MPAKKKNQGANPNAPARATAAAVREDVYIVNDSTGFLITSRRVKGLEIEPGDPQWAKRFADGDFIPVELYGDSSFVMRVVVNDQLTAQEKDEWVGKATLKLDVSDGQMVVVGGREYITEVSEWTENHLCKYVQTVAIPPGQYKLELYVYITSINGTPLMYQACGEETALGSYFRRSRRASAEDFPEWLRYLCIGDSEDTDPGFEEDWEGLRLSQPETHYVDFLAHLTDLGKEQISALPLQDEFINWAVMESRKPKKCPLGIASSDPRGLPSPQSSRADYNYVDVLAATAGRNFAAAPVKGAPLSVAPENIHWLYVLARAANLGACPQFQFHGDACAEIARQLSSLPEEYQVELDEKTKTVIVRIAESGARWLTLSMARAFAEAMKKISLADGTRFEVVTAVVEGGSLITDSGLMRYSGTVKKGLLNVESAYPPITAERLKEALSLAEAAESEDVLDFPISNIEAARKALLCWTVQWKPLQLNNMAELEGNRYRFKEVELTAKHLLLEDYVRCAFADIWPVRELHQDTVAAVEQEIARQAAATTIVFVAGDRTYTGGTIETFDEDEREEAQKFHDALCDMDATHVGDLACTAFAKFVFRYYLMPDPASRLIWYRQPYMNTMMEIQTYFPDQALVITSNTRYSEPNPPDNLYHHYIKTDDATAMYEAHKQQVAAATKKHGQPLNFETSLEDCAKKFEAAIQRQLRK